MGGCKTATDTDPHVLTDVVCGVKGYGVFRCEEAQCPRTTPNRVRVPMSFVQRCVQCGESKVFLIREHSIVHGVHGFIADAFHHSRVKLGCSQRINKVRDTQSPWSIWHRRRYRVLQTMTSNLLPVGNSCVLNNSARWFHLHQPSSGIGRKPS